MVSRATRPRYYSDPRGSYGKHAPVERYATVATGELNPARNKSLYRVDSGACPAEGGADRFPIRIR